MSDNEKVEIPNEAVEAAAKALYDREGYSTGLPDAPAHRRSRYLDEAQTILEAAVPHMLAGAWDEGRNAEKWRLRGTVVDVATNPYRSAK